jgi:predicted transcriptional regulator
MRFAPGDVARTSWPQPTIEPSGAKFAAPGSGWVEYDVAVPANIDLERVRRIVIRLEASARAGTKKVDWPQQLRGRQYPQTEERKSPSDLAIMLNGIGLGVTRLPDDPADACGTLSHFRGYDPGSYGYLVEREIIDRSLEEVKRTVGTTGTFRLRLEVRPDAEQQNGLAIYGETLGCYPVEPMIVVEE